MSEIDWKRLAKRWEDLYKNEKGNATALFRYLQTIGKLYKAEEWEDWERQYGKRRPS